MLGSSPQVAKRTVCLGNPNLSAAGAGGHMLMFAHDRSNRGTDVEGNSLLRASVCKVHGKSVWGSSSNHLGVL